MRAVKSSLVLTRDQKSLKKQGEVGPMKFERLPPMPSKSRLSWQISRLQLDASGHTWLATGVKRDLVATIVLPARERDTSEETWIAAIEAAFDERSRSVFDTHESVGALHGPSKS